MWGKEAESFREFDWLVELSRRVSCKASGEVSVSRGMSREGSRRASRKACGEVSVSHGVSREGSFGMPRVVSRVVPRIVSRVVSEVVSRVVELSDFTKDWKQVMRGYNIVAGRF